MKALINRTIISIITLIIVFAFFAPAVSYAASPRRTVRVGWHEAPYYIEDKTGRKSGYSYEYQQKVAAYTGWEYEYVKGSWSELLGMLADGEIDMLANVSYTKERAKSMLYASVPMGTESYYLFTSPDNTDISSEDYKTLNGKRTGVAKGSVQSELFRDWAASHNVSPVIIETTGTEEQSIDLLGKDLDAFVTMDNNGDPNKAAPLCKIGSSDYFFAVSKKSADLLPELNAAMNSIQDENKFFNQELSDKYLLNTGAGMYLSSEEKAWLNNHGTIRVGYQDNYLAFCAKDKKTGDFTGALKDCLDYMSTVLENARFDYEAVAFDSAGDAIEALKRGDVDCVFPANLTAYDSEELRVSMTPALMKTEMDAVVRASDKKEFLTKDDIIVAVNKGNTNYELFLKENYPGWQIRYFDDTPAGLEAVAAGDADCVIISNYRFSNIAKQCEKLHLTTVYTGVDSDYYLAVNSGERELYSILSKAIALVPASVVNSALTYYSTEDARVTFVDIIKDNLIAVLLTLILVVLVILLLLLRSIRAEKKALEEEKTISVLNKQVYLDALTHVRNKGAFNDYIDRLQKMADNGEKLELAIGMFDCNNLKIVNDKYGHDKGDMYLKGSSRLICDVFKHSPVFRIGGDEFAVILQNEDLHNKDELIRKFAEATDEICSASDKMWEQVRVASGIAVYDPKIDRAVLDTVRRADQLMYQNKRKDEERR